MKKIPVAIIGASGYSGEELVRLLLSHPGVDLVTVTSRQNVGQSVAEVFPRFANNQKAKKLKFSEADADALAQTSDIVFLALPHGVAAEFAVPLVKNGCRVIDLSADFRVKDPAAYKEFYAHEHPAPAFLAQAVYGLPELYRDKIHQAKLVASPGCYPTSILLPIIPLLKERIIKPTGIIANSLSAVSGAGRKVDANYLFVECNESARPYSIPKHRHLSEIEQELSLAAEEKVTIQFSPHLIPINRGIISTIYVAPEKHFSNETERKALGETISVCYQTAYGIKPFIRLLEGAALPDTKNVAGTNTIEIAWRLDARTGRLILMSAVDNLVKGASGQAVQSMNLMCDFPETEGLS